MIAIELRFLTGRVHATPWGRQVNEGVVEWPLSPWRILRALIATWYQKAQDRVEESTLRSLIDKLAPDPPSFYLPKASTGHTRHYMPYLKGSEQKTTMVFDTFVHILNQESVRITWPNVDLTPDETQVLHILLERMGYFGRAESLVEAALDSQPADNLNAKPLIDGDRLRADEELVRLIAPMLDTDYQMWREGYLAAVKSPEESSKKPKKKAAAVSLPANVFEALLADTGDLKKAGWNQPPGSRWVDYALPRDAFKIQPVARVVSAPRLPTVARFVIASQVLPLLTQAVSVAERVHQTLVKVSDNAPVFTGRDGDSSPLQGHRHCYIFCESTTHRGTINSLTLYAPMGFDSNARTALERLRLRKVWGHGGHDLQMILLGVGERDQCPLFAEAPEWRSVTPFVSTRHAKIHHDGRPKLDESGLPIGSAEHDLRRLIREAGLPEPIQITAMKVGQLGGKPVNWLSFQRTRKHGDGRHAGQVGHGFQILFPQPVRGPLAFGYACHMGLGLFLPA